MSYLDQTSRMGDQNCPDDAVLKRKWKQNTDKVRKRVGHPLLWTCPSSSRCPKADLTFSSQTLFGGGRWMESLALMCLLSFPSFDLSCYYHLLPAVRCSAVTAPPGNTRADRRGGSCSAPKRPPPPFCLGYASRRWQKMEGGKEEQMTISWEARKEGKWEKRQEGRGTEEDGERRRELSSKSDSLLLDIEPSWEAGS